MLRRATPTTPRAPAPRRAGSNGWKIGLMALGGLLGLSALAACHAPPTSPDAPAAGGDPPVAPPAETAAPGTSPAPAPPSPAEAAEAPAPPAEAGKAPLGGSCRGPGDCAEGLVCQGGEGCDARWTCGEPLHCTRDLVVYCGCDGQTFSGSGSCPSRPYARRGPCTGETR